MTRDILDAIDGAVHDWEVSSDAMRWSPDPPKSPPMPRPQRYARVNIRIDTSVFAAELRRMFDAVAAMAPALERIGRALAKVCDQHDEHHPPPLSIDGHAYRRRSQARRRRRRS
jgi:hypothetical protein